jgi:hypothetical protein
MDANYDRRLDVTEFKRGAMYLGLWLTPETAAAEFDKVGGFFLCFYALFFLNLTAAHSQTTLRST